MTHPLPFIRADTLERQIEVITAIYGQGWLFSTHRTLAAAIKSVSSGNIEPRRISYSMNDRRFWFMSYSPPNHTIMNSIEHLIDYTKRHYDPMTAVKSGWHTTPTINV